MLSLFAVLLVEEEGEKEKHTKETNNETTKDTSPSSSTSSAVAQHLSSSSKIAIGFIPALTTLPLINTTHTTTIIKDTALKYNYVL